jgi:hypothetical protein
MNFKKQFLPDRRFEKLKERLCAHGYEQDRTLYHEYDEASPTISTQSVFMIADIAAKEERAVATFDYPGAFLNSEIPHKHNPIQRRQ